MRHRGNVHRSLAALLLVGMLLAAALAGCGGDDAPETGVTTATATEKTGPSPREIEVYVEQVRELIHIGAQLNSGYGDLVDRYNSKSVAAAEVIAQAGRNETAYGDMISQLDSIDVPEGLEDAHDKVVSGFDKWQRRYALDARGLEENNSALLDQARALDIEAAAEVNEAIGEINRFKN
ncbi:MAG: hypothetical protein ACYC5A_01795 [Thermoleophilia bacterium]